MVKKTRKSIEGNLKDICGRLSDHSLEQLLMHARSLLAEQSQPVAAAPGDPDVPIPETRPPGETVLKALQRLTRSYFMLDKKQLLEDAYRLMMEHHMNGRDADAVIDEMEQIFRDHYDQYVAKE